MDFLFEYEEDEENSDIIHIKISTILKRTEEILTGSLLISKRAATLHGEIAIRTAVHNLFVFLLEERAKRLR